MPDMVQREHFTQRTGETVEARGQGDDAVPLRIDRVEDFGAEDGLRFSVFLSGPGDRLLAQGIYHVGPARDEADEADEAFELFLVPIGREQDRYVYEAAFNREGS